VISFWYAEWRYQRFGLINYSRSNAYCRMAQLSHVRFPGPAEPMKRDGRIGMAACLFRDGIVKRARVAARVAN
jgi:hypothetical protein